jgi:hypothetical protein
MWGTTSGSEKKKMKIGVGYWESFSPQLPQNFVPAGFFVLHFGQVTSVPAAGRGFPQLPQNFIPAGFSALQLGQTIIGAGARLVPQLPQNFVPTGFFVPHFWQTITSWGFPA